LHARPSGAAAEALCRLNATFAHPNAYPMRIAGPFVADLLFKEVIVLIVFLMIHEATSAGF
jgi:hypothetical protein